MELREKFISSNKHPTTLWIFHIFYYTSYTFCIYHTFCTFLHLQISHKRITHIETSKHSKKFTKPNTRTMHESRLIIIIAALETEAGLPSSIKRRSTVRVSLYPVGEQHNRYGRCPRFAESLFLG